MKNQSRADGAEIKKEIPGPGSYNPDKADIFPIYKYKGSGVFLSKVHRDNGGKKLNKPPLPSYK